VQITGIILAGGKSTRMGTDKALIKIGDKNLLETVIEICKPVCKTIIISSNNPEHANYGYPVVIDEINECGPIGGIYSCIKKSETDWNFVISVDTPFVASGFIQFLFQQCGDFDAIIPAYSGKTEPLIALYNQSCLPVIEKQIQLQRFKINHLVALLNTGFVECGEWLEKTPLLFKNLNHPEDLSI
jgi:molybdopterin-guanine dinucleotide biosynthesis protein A